VNTPASHPAVQQSGRPAVFLDRDGTIVADPGYLRHPDDVELLSGAGPAIARLNAGNRAVVVVTNQSGMARGRLTEAEYHRVTARLTQLLRQAGARVDATYFCPHAPEQGACPCRKPAVGLFERAAREHGLDLGASWWVGDRLNDLLPARTLGGRGVLVETGDGLTHRAAARAEGFEIAADLPTAVTRILAPPG
jgi:histidinol-phosphate phosphatase family protein